MHAQLTIAIQLCLSPNSHASHHLALLAPSDPMPDTSINLPIGKSTPFLDISMHP